MCGFHVLRHAPPPLSAPRGGTFCPTCVRMERNDYIYRVRTSEAPFTLFVRPRGVPYVAPRNPHVQVRKPKRERGRGDSTHYRLWHPTFSTVQHTYPNVHQPHVPQRFPYVHQHILTHQPLRYSTLLNVCISTVYILYSIANAIPLKRKS